MNKWISSLLAVLSVGTMQAQQAVETPKLVVNIVVDQLRGDYLNYCNYMFGDRGFKRLMSGGLVYHTVDFGFPNLNETSAVATIQTGAYPYYHGIAAATYWSTDYNREISVLDDINFMGNYTSDRYSPLHLLASTLGDELKTASRGEARVYAIAPNAPAAILSAGRYGNCAFWLDNVNGQWATTTYYKDVPRFVDKYNSNEAWAKAAELDWTPSYSGYIAFPYAKAETKPFAYKFVKTDNDRFRKMKQTALVNTEVTNLAIQFLDNAAFATLPGASLLNLTYYAGNYLYSADPATYSNELQDTYYRLDKDLGRLLDRIDQKVGLSKTVIVLTSTGYYDSVDKPSDDFKPYGEFHGGRCSALLNMYLMAIYGQGNWVSGYFDKQIFLNKKLAEEQQVKWNDLLHSAADFVAQFSGVQEVTTAANWQVDDTGRAADFRRGMPKKGSGDIFIELQPGWVELNIYTQKRQDTSRETAILAPLIIFGDKIRREQIERPVKVTEIAPTLSYILRIRPPNACKDLPLREVIR